MIRVIVCDDQDIVREGLMTILSTDREISVDGTAADGRELIQLLEDTQEAGNPLPDVILLDLKMPVMNGILAAKHIHRNYPGIKILVLTTYSTDEWIFDAVKAGASGYLLKDTPKHELFDAVKGTAKGSSYVDPSIAGKVLQMITGDITLPENSGENFHLSHRERTILLYIARGYSNQEIADKLFLSPGTVRNYTSSIFSRLSVTDRTQAAIAALRYRLIRLEDI
ncbi:MAG: response regulator transcription factor [Spirochaetia bacterium]|nr:response regulator transcription factor [Spirochaetia bacterium]